MAEKTQKRKISLSFELPESIKDNDTTIYVAFSLKSYGVMIPRTKLISCQVTSSKEFQYSLADGEVKKTTSTDNGSNASSYVPCERFLQDLIDYNNGEICFDRLIEQGVSFKKRLDNIVG